MRLVAQRAVAVLPSLVRVSALAGLAVLALAGCAKTDAALSRRWVDASFRSVTSVAQVLRIRAACSHVTIVKAVPIAGNLPALDTV